MIQGNNSKSNQLQINRVSAFCTASDYDLKILVKQLLISGHWDVNKWDEVVYATPKILPKSSRQSPATSQSSLKDLLPKQELFFMEFGAVIAWGFSEEEEESLLSSTLLKGIEVNRYEQDQIQSEFFKSFVDHQRVSSKIIQDMIILHEDDVMIKLAFSLAIAQSVKLGRFEDMVEETLVKVQTIPHQVAENGKVKMSRQESIKTIGLLFEMRSKVNLIAPILDTPEIFWTEPSLIPTYETVRTYLEISNRITIINQRALVIGDMLDMLNNFLNKTHAESLEWIVIILIAISVTLAACTIYIKITHFLDQDKQ